MPKMSYSEQERLAEGDRPRAAQKAQKASLNSQTAAQNALSTAQNGATRSAIADYGQFITRHSKRVLKMC